MTTLDDARTAWLDRLDGGTAASSSIVAALPEAWRARSGLSTAAAEWVVLCALAVLDGRVATACGVARGAEDAPWPTISLALAQVPGLTWADVVSTAPARTAGLVEVVDPTQPTTSRVTSPERVWATLVGQRVADPLLAAVAGPSVEPSTRLQPHTPPFEVLQTRDVVWVGSTRDTLLPAVSAFFARAQRPWLRVRADLLPEQIGAIATAVRREQTLEGAVLVVDLLDATDAGRHRAWQLVRQAWGTVVRLERQPVALGERPFVPVAVAPPSLPDRVDAWRAALAPLALPPDQQEAAAWRLGDAFRLSTTARRSVVALSAGAPDPVDAIWRTASAHAVRPPGRLVQVQDEPMVGWDALVVEDSVRAGLQELVDAARNRARVMAAQGMAVGRAGGLTALFSGPSGTGKTLAAEVVAGALGLSLWRIDLSMVVSKYIGETEKHLGAVFDAAEGAGALLLFDEADALFAQRSDVGDARDRYANLEVGFLLQRIEAFGGLAILTTNLEDQLDGAFQRRVFSVVRFGFPSRALRQALWERVFPPAVPTRGLDPARLARVQLSGAGIRSVATRAAFLAAAGTPSTEAPPPVTMSILARAVRIAAEQQGRVLSAREIDGWE